jgi:hypothetical protein
MSTLYDPAQDAIVSEIWAELQIEETTDIRAIRRAYALRLKIVHPEDDPDGFQNLRRAYETALFLASTSDRHPPGQESSSFDETNAKENSGRELQTGSTVGFSFDLRLQETQDDGVPCSAEWAERAHQLVQGVLDVLSKEGDSAAAIRLRETSKSTELENIELRAHFEDVLLQSLGRLDPLPCELLEASASGFDWEKHGSLACREFDLTLDYLLGRLRGWRAYNNLLRISGQKPIQVLGASADSIPPTRLQSEAAAIIIGKYDPVRFRGKLFFRPNLNKAVRDQLERLENFAPQVLEFHVDRNVVDWWSKRGFIARLLSKLPKVSGKSRGNSSNMLFKIVWWLLMVVGYSFLKSISRTDIRGFLQLWPIWLAAICVVLILRFRGRILSIKPD